MAPASRLSLLYPTRKAASIGFAALGICLILWLNSHLMRHNRKSALETLPNSRREEIKDVFITSWDAYSKHAWGCDRFHPISKKGSQMSPHGLGWIIVDSLDTLMIMGLTSRLSDARLWVHRQLEYDQNQDVNTFETTIRMLGGLLSAHYLAKKLPGVSSKRDSVYLSKAVDLADRLLGAYESPSGIPYASVNLHTRKGIRSHANRGASSTSEATTLQLEMKYLSYLTGNQIYWHKAERVMEALESNNAEDGLVPIFVSAETGQFTSREIRLGSRGDSYYEYLIKQYLQTSGQEPVYLDMWEEALAGVQKHLIAHTRYSKMTFVAELPNGIGSPTSPKMDHLVCFSPGTIALGATGGLTEAEARKLPSWTPKKAQQMNLARELMETCWGMYRVTETQLAPEIIWFDPEDKSKPSDPEPLPWQSREKSETLWEKDYTIKPLDSHNLQRPETVESLFMMWRITNDPIYREWGWAIFEAFKKHTIVDDGEGFASLHNVNQIPPPQRDNMESFWLAETLKYLYLLFSPNDLLPLSEVVFNTEGHVFPMIKPRKLRTGWERNKNTL